MLSDKEYRNYFQETIKSSGCIECSLPFSDFPQNCCLGPAPQASFVEQLNSSGADCCNWERKIMPSPLMYEGMLLYWQRESRRRGMSLWNKLTHNYHAPCYSLLGVKGLWLCLGFPQHKGWSNLCKITVPLNDTHYKGFSISRKTK